jgi:hypothetical protein
MAKYKIKAPDGNTYSIDGPDGATDEQVRAEVLKQHPTAGGEAAPAAPKVPAAPVKNVAQEEADKNSFGENLLLGVGKNVSDTLLGGKQLINAVSGNRLFDKDKLAKEVAGNKMANEAISGTGGGVAGDLGMSMLTSALPMGAATKAASAAKFLPKIVQGLAPSVAMGAGQAALTPDEDYSLGKELGTGGAAGVVGDVLGRGVGRVLKPMQGLIPQAVKERVAMLPQDATLLAENITNSPAIKALTNAFAQLPVVGGKVVKAREGNLGEVTKAITGAAGMEVPALTPSASKALHDRVGAQAERFGMGPDLEVPGMIPALQAAQSAPEQLAARLLGTTKPATQMRSAEAALTPQLTPPAPPSPILMPSGQPFPAPPAALIPPPIPKIPAQDAMNLRRELGDQVFTGEHGISTQGAQTIKDQIEDALRNRHGADAFDTWKKEHGHSLDIRKTQNAGGVTEAGHIKPEAFQNTLPATEVANPTTPLNRMVNAASEQMKSPSLAENRSAMVRSLMGAPVAAGLAGGATALGAGQGGGGATAAGLGTTAGTLALASALLGTAGGGRYLTGQNKSAVGKALQSDKAKELARLLGTSSMNQLFQ